MAHPKRAGCRFCLQSCKLLENRPSQPPEPGPVLREVLSLQAMLCCRSQGHGERQGLTIHKLRIEIKSLDSSRL